MLPINLIIGKLYLVKLKEEGIKSPDKSKKGVHDLKAHDPSSLIGRTSNDYVDLNTKSSKPNNKRKEKVYDLTHDLISSVGRSSTNDYLDLEKKPTNETE